MEKCTDFAQTKDQLGVGPMGLSHPFPPHVTYNVTSVRPTPGRPAAALAWPLMAEPAMVLTYGVVRVM